MKLNRFLIIILVAITATCAHASPQKKINLDDLMFILSANNQDYSSKDKELAQSSAVNNLLLHAMSLIGVAYRFGGSTPATGLDCSGFIQYIFKKSLSINLPRTSAQMAKTGKAVRRDELLPGDLIFFNTHGRGVSHVGMYIGNGKFIHAPRTGKTIQIVMLDTPYWNKRYLGARRIKRNKLANEFTEQKSQSMRVESAIQPQLNKANTNDNPQDIKNYSEVADANAASVNNSKNDLASAKQVPTISEELTEKQNLQAKPVIVHTRELTTNNKPVKEHTADLAHSEDNLVAELNAKSTTKEEPPIAVHKHKKGLNAAQNTPKKTTTMHRKKMSHNKKSNKKTKARDQNQSMSWSLDKAPR